MDSIRQQPVIDSTIHTQATTSTAKIEKALSATKSGTPAPITITADVATIQRDYLSIKAASLKETEAFLSQHRNTLPDLMIPIGAFDDKGSMVLGVGNKLIRVDLNTLCTAIANAGEEGKSKFVRALLILEAAHDSQLPDGAIQGILNHYREALTPHGEQPALSPSSAMQQCFAQIAMASLVESYVINKQGLATDIRRVASFAQDAFSAAETGSMMDALANATVRRDLILSQQDKLDDALNAFTASMSQARISGDYSQAFDKLQHFFDTASDVTETQHWRMRVADPTSACPPLKRESIELAGQRLLTAATEFTRPEPPKLTAAKVQTRTTWETIKNALKAPFVAIGRLFSGNAPGTKGLVGVQAATRLVTELGKESAVGALRQPPAPTWKEAEKRLQEAFGSKASDLAHEASSKGHLTELVNVAHMAHAVQIKPTELIRLIGSKPSAEQLKALHTGLKIIHSNGHVPTKENGAALLLAAVVQNPRLAPLLETFNKIAPAQTYGKLVEDTQKVDQDMQSGKRDAFMNAARLAFMRARVPADPSARELFNTHIKTREDLHRLLDDASVPRQLGNSAWFALALTPPHARSDAMQKLERMEKAMGRIPFRLNQSADLHKLLHDMPTGPAFDRLENLVKTVYTVKSTEGDGRIPIADAIALAKELSGAEFDRLEKLARQFAAIHPDVREKELRFLMTVPAGPATEVLCDTILPKVPVLFLKDGPERAAKLAMALAEKGLVPPQADLFEQLLRMVQAQKDVSTDQMVTLLDPKRTTAGLSKDHAYTSPYLGHVPPVWKPDLMWDKSGFEPSAPLDTSNVSMTQFWKKPVGGDPPKYDRFMVKVPPVDDGVDESFVPAMERMLSVLGNQMGLPVNFVQLAETKDVAPQMGIDQPKAKYASIHTPVGPTVKFIYEVSDLMGFPGDEPDFRSRPQDINSEPGRGLSNWFRPDADAHMQKLKGGVQRMIMPDGTVLPPKEPLPQGARLRTFRIENPEVLDQTVFFDKIIGNADRHAKNILLVPHEDDKNGVTSYTVHLIDHGRAFFSSRAYAHGEVDTSQDYIKERLTQFETYLKSLTLPENATHLANIRAVMENFADLTPQQLLKDPIEGIPQDAFQSPEALKEQLAILEGSQQLVRQFLAGSPGGV